MEDQTDSTDTQLALVQSEQRFRDLIENTSDWIWEVDDSIRYVYTSPKVTELLGYTPEEVLGKTPFDFMPAEEAARLRRSIDELVRQPHPFQAIENVNVHKDGSLRVLETSGVPILDAEGRFTGLRGIDRDITERKKVQHALQAALVVTAQEKARSEAIIAALGEGLIIVDREFKIIYQNQVMKDLTGDDSEEHCYVMYGNQRQNCEMCPVAWTFSDGEIHTMEKSAVKDGRTVYREITASPLRDDSGAITAGVVLVRDITERKRSDDALKESERQMKEVQRIANLGSWQLDYATNRLVWSDETYRILGLEPQQIPASYKTFLEIVHPEDREQLEARYSESVKDGSDVYEHEHRIVRNPGGEIRHIHQKCEHIKDDTGQVIRSYGMFHDITLRKEAEERIRVLNSDLSARAAELEMVNKDLEAFSYTVSHDLRGPLTNINSYCQAIFEFCGDKLDVQCVGFMRSVFKEVERMDQLITSLLNLSRFTHIKLVPGSVDLSEMARTIAAELQIREPERRVRFDIVEGIAVPGDGKLLRMVLMNLLSNAWKFSAKKRDSVISFGVTESQGRQIYFVSDNGIGFDMSECEKIFAVFQRLHRREEFDGFGIGLTTVQKIIQRHNGRIWAEGEPGKGATFSFTLHENV
jgi:PAS domain S-box-containing protein